MKPKDWFMLGVKLAALAYVVESGFSPEYDAYLIYCTSPDKQKGYAVIFDNTTFELPFTDGEFVNMGYCVGHGLVKNLTRLEPKHKPTIATYGDAVFG